jgi:prepilin-type N-terminal cleavage/methylation domain-containing protein
MSRVISPHGADSGFTLLEILVGLVISSLIMVGLSLAMKTINMGFDQATVSIGRQGTIATGLYIAAGDISRIERVFDNPEQPGQFLFAGSRGEAVYILAERPGNNRAGLYWVRLLVRKTGDGAELVRMRAPYRQGQQDFAAIEWRDEVVLLRGGLAIELSYRAPRSGLRDWANSWLARNMLPGEIKIEIGDVGTGRLRVPVFVQTLKIGAEADCVAAGTPGCTMNSGGLISPPNRSQ